MCITTSFIVISIIILLRMAGLMTLMAWSSTRDVTISSINFTMIPNGVQCTGPMRQAETCFIGMKSQLLFIQMQQVTCSQALSWLIVPIAQASSNLRKVAWWLLSLQMVMGNGLRLPIVRTRGELGKNMTRWLPTGLRTHFKTKISVTLRSSAGITNGLWSLLVVHSAFILHKT